MPFSLLEQWVQLTCDVQRLVFSRKPVQICRAHHPRALFGVRFSDVDAAGLVLHRVPPADF